MNKTFYFNAAEAVWIEGQGKGYVRGLVQADMNEVTVPPTEKAMNIVMVDHIEKALENKG